MAAQIRSLQGFDDLLEQAGLGSLVWSFWSYLAARYYHYIIAAFTSLILLFGLALHTPDLFALVAVAGYGGYFLFRKLMPARWERAFYRPNIQFARAQAALVFITLLLLAVADADRMTLWLLFVPVILLTSKHCSTWRLLIVIGEAGLILLAVRLTRSSVPLTSPDFFTANADLWLQYLWIGQLTFILHFLVRNVQARNETIAAYSAVNQLARDVDMTDTGSAQQWQPLLMALVQHLKGGCASTWLIDPKTQRLRRIAGVTRQPQTEQWTMPDDTEPVPELALDSEDLLAVVARTGRSAHAHPAAASQARTLCPDLAAELAVPINIGSHERGMTLGVLSIGFRAPAFRARLVPEYVNYMQALINQAKGMLIYAQRLDELLALQDVSRQVSHSLDLNTVLDSILAAMVGTLGFEFATISLVDEDRGLIRSVRGRNVPADWLAAAVHPLDSRDIQAHIVRTGETLVITGWDERFDWRIYDQFGHDAMTRVFTPICARDETTGAARAIGTIEAGYFRADQAMVSRDQLRLLNAFTIQMALAIEHAQLLQRIQKKADMLTSLHHVGQAITGARNPAAVLNEIGAKARTLLNADIVMVYRYHAAEPRIEPPLICGAVEARFRPNLDVTQENLLTRLLKETRPYYSPDALHDPLLATPADEAGNRPSRSKKTFVQRRNIRSFVALPLIAQGETLGLMFVNYFGRRQFDSDDRQAHELFAQQAAVALKNAYSHELARELAVREERVRLSRELHHSVSQALFSIKTKAYHLLEDVGIPEPDVRDEVGKIFEIAHETSNDTGFIIDELRAPTDENRHLVTGVEEYVRRIKRWYNLEVTWDVTACPVLAPKVEQALLRLAREALNNAVRHAHCKAITVRCEADEQQLRLTIHDDGRGFNPASVLPGKWGLINMRDLAIEAGGEFTIESMPGQGTRIRVCVSLQPEEEDS